MLRQTISYRKDLDTRKMPTSKEKIELKFAIQKTQIKAKPPTENVDI